jgi:DNA-binding transcriptional ArsR family regulator
MSLTNPMGDLLVTDPQAMRALAHPVRLAVLSYLQRNGPATATQLAPNVGATPSVTSWHLRHLAGFGLVVDAAADEVPGDRRQRWWKAAARGFSFEIGEDPESQAAGRVLADQLYATARQQVDRWLGETEPRLEPVWRRISGISNTTIMLTADELEDLELRIDEAIARYVRRPESDAPAGAHRVRILRHYLPEADLPAALPGSDSPDALPGAGSSEGPPGSDSPEDLTDADPQGGGR